ncbi:MAG: outer membrane lipoprotein chaperone LolA [Pseudomonadota bacterium]
MSAIKFLFLALVVMPLQLMAQTSEQQLSDILQSLQTLEADFYQQVIDADGEIVQEAKGTFELKRPGKFRWHYDPPYSQHIIADGKNLWMLDLELAQATVQPLDEALGNAPIILLTESKPLTDDFEIRDMPDEFGLQWIALAPKIQDTEFYRVEIGMNDGLIREMKLHDHFDQQTIIRFSNFKSDSSLPDSRFLFTVPDGVDVIGTPH